MSGMTHRELGSCLLSALALIALSTASNSSARAQEHLEGERGRGGGHDDGMTADTTVATITALEAAVAAEGDGPAAAKAAARVPAGPSATSSRVWTRAKPTLAGEWAAADRWAAADTNDRKPNADPRVGEQA